MISLPKILIGAAVALGLVGLLAFAAQSCNKGKETHAETQAEYERGKADGLAQKAKEADAQVGEIQAIVDAQAKDLSRLTEERDAAIRQLASERKRGSSTDRPAGDAIGPVVASAPDGRDAVIEADARLISAQSQQIGSLTLQVSVLTIARDSYKSAFEAEQRRSASLQIALDAQKAVSASGKWLYRAQGLAIGIGAGYIAGRLH